MGKREDKDMISDSESFEIKLWNKDKLNKKSGLWFIQFITLLKKNVILQVCTYIQYLSVYIYIY